MPRTTYELLVPETLDAKAHASLVDALYRVHCEIFDGVSRDNFVHYVIDSPADHTQVLVHRNEQREVVGYFALHQFRRSVRGQPVLILRAEMGSLREYRGQANNLQFGVREIGRIVASNRGMPMYLLGCLVHPSSYYYLAKYAVRMWPHHAQRPDADLLGLMCELGDSFGLEPVGDDPLVRKVGWRTRDSAAERAFWQRYDKPDVRFYVEQNPGYVEGNGLLTLVPLTPGQIAGGLARLGRERSERQLQDAWARAHHLPILSRWLAPAELRRRLRAVSLFRGLDDQQLARVAARAEISTLPAGRVLMQQGERGDELFVIDSGSVRIVASRRNEEVLLDQLDAGDVFGEIATLTGEPRTATARTATRCTLIRLTRAALLDAMAGDPALSEAVWSRYAERRFEYAAETQSVLARMSRASRIAFLRNGETHELAAGSQREFAGPGFVFAVQGEVTLEHGGARISSLAPILLEFAADVRIEARAASRVIVLPPAPEPSPRELFREHPLLTRLSDREFTLLLDSASALHLESGAVLFAAGDPADAFYLIRSGAIDVMLGGEPVARLGAGECFGERGLDPSGTGRRSAGARALGPTDLLRVSSDVFFAVVAPVIHGSDRAPTPPRDQLSTMVGGAWAHEPPPETEMHRFAIGQTIIAENEPPDSVWYLVEGLARVEQRGEVISQVRPGQCFGERAVLLDTPRSASVVCETPVVANRMDAAAFRAWVGRQPQLEDLLATLAQIHRSADGARTTTVYRGAYEGESCLTSIARLADGRSFTAIKLEQRPMLILASDDGGGPATEHVEYERAAPGDRRRLDYRGERPLAIVLEGDLGLAAACSARLRQGQPLTRGELERFRWTGRLGASVGGPERLVCGCVGLTRAELEQAQARGGSTLVLIGERTGAGTVCGGCVPLLRRVLTDEGASASYIDEVDSEAFEARLDGLRHVDAARSLFGPETVIWRVYGETVALLGASRALLLQFAHPLAQALVEHSLFGADAGMRLHRTLEAVYGMAFGEGATMLRVAREVHEKHVGVVGRYHETHGPIRAGDRYAANQVELLLWVGATVVDTSVCTHEALIGPLSAAEKDRLIAESADILGLFGIPRSRVPASWAAFRAYFDGMLSSGTLHVGEHSRMLADAVLRAPRPASEPLFAILRQLTARWLPAPLRAPFGLDDGPVARASSAALEQAIRLAVPRLPRELRICPARLHAERRLRGEVGPDPAAARLEQVIAYMLGVEAPDEVH
jgi:CRP-like cAMP-binding protein/uncharacterized protein (DUF2236 family)/bacterioferritin-associated ferredoxin